MSRRASILGTYFMRINQEFGHSGHYDKAQIDFDFVDCPGVNTPKAPLISFR